MNLEQQQRWCLWLVDCTAATVHESCLVTVLHDVTRSCLILSYKFLRVSTRKGMKGMKRPAIWWGGTCCPRLDLTAPNLTIHSTSTTEAWTCSRRSLFVGELGVSGSASLRVSRRHLNCSTKGIQCASPWATGYDYRLLLFERSRHTLAGAPDGTVMSLGRGLLPHVVSVYTVFTILDI